MNLIVFESFLLILKNWNYFILLFSLVIKFHITFHFFISSLWDVQARIKASYSFCAWQHNLQSATWETMTNRKIQLVFFLFWTSRKVHKLWSDWEFLWCGGSFRRWNFEEVEIFGGIFRRWNFFCLLKFLGGIFRRWKF